MNSRFSLSQNEIRKGYRIIKRMAQKSFSSGDIDKSLEYIDHCAIIAQQFNWIYADDELEDLLMDIGKEVISNETSEYSPENDRVVFYDDFCTSFVLALQYLRVLVKAGKKILYITSRNIDEKDKFSNILEEVSSYEGTTILAIPQGDRVSNIKNTYQAIVDFHPKKILLHMKATSIVHPVLYVLPESIERYVINLADQTFWLGEKAIDYSLEFRQFGVSVSLQKRNLRKEQLLLIPFYPIQDRNPFEGFPRNCTKDKVIVFSGGDLYKVLDDKKTYWNLVKQILIKHPEVVFLFATKRNTRGEQDIKKFVDDNNFSDRFIHINYRKDIDQVFKHCDIYMGTCPASGSLMSQLAAVNAKPIIQYYYPGTPDDETEQAICFNDSFQISHREITSFLEEADRLITDKKYREVQGRKLQTAMISEDQFNDLVIHSLQENITQVELKPYSFDYSFLTERWYALEKELYINTAPYIYGIIGRKNCILKLPTLFIKKQMNKLSRRGNQ